MLWLRIICSNTDLYSVNIQRVRNVMVEHDNSCLGINRF
jgi:hypothetical protein